MSWRYFSFRIFNNGRYVCRIFFKQYTSTAPAAQRSERFFNNDFEKSVINQQSSTIRNVGSEVSKQARKLLADTVLDRATTCVSADLRKKTIKRLLYGDAAPFFAFVGVSLASKAGVLSKEDELEGLCLEIRDAITKFQWNAISVDLNEIGFALEQITLDRLVIGPPIGQGSSAVIYAAKLKDDLHSSFVEAADESGFPLALKMMFNYDVQSSAMAILRAMYRETIPARRFYSNDDVAAWESVFSQNRVKLPPHPNIVAMYSVFVDYVPQLSGSMMLYPDALPARLNPEGYGRNMSLFLLMKRYQFSLIDYLRLHKLSPKKSILLLAQLLEAVTHMNMYGIAHRDLKSDNILVDALFSETDDSVPIVVVTDFGFCLADYLNGLHIPYNSDSIEIGGNSALMAPEIALQRPGPFSMLNYTKSDLWAVGAIAYEIFGQDNPFYKSSSGQESLRNTTYKEEQLPDLGQDVPLLMKKLVKNILSRNPKERLTAEVAANVCQLYLWAPSNWIKSKSRPSSTEILQWLLCLTTKVLYEGRLLDNYPDAEKQIGQSKKINEVFSLMTSKSSRRTHPEYVLISSFLGRARLTQIKQAITWIQNNNGLEQA